MMRTITVRGVGNVSAKPDYITISMTIESIRKDYEGAMKDASERISKLQDVAVRSGYAKEDLKTTSFNVDTRYESVKDRQGNYKREFAGYACVYRLKLAFDFDSKQLAEVISCISNCGANPELSIAFTVRNPAKVSAELLESAALNARAKAEILCRASGCEMGQLKSAFRSKHEAELVIFEAAKTTLLAMQGDQKLPSLKALQAEQQRLIDEQQGLYDERARLKKEMKQIDTIKANVDMLLRIGDGQEQTQQRVSQRE